MRWTAIGSGFFCPVAVSPRPGQLALFARGATGELLHMRWEGGRWGEIGSLGVPAVRAGGVPDPVPVDWPVAACSGGAKRIDLFARSPDGDLLQMSGDGMEWGAFECLGAPASSDAGVAIPLGLVGPPAACSASADRIDVFATGQTGELLHTFWNGAGWSGFESLGVSARRGGRERSVPLSGPLAACRCGADRIALFIRGSAGDLMMRWWDGMRWDEFASIGWPELQDETYPAVAFPIALTGPPAACGSRDRIDVFARAARGEIVHRSWNGREWGEYVSLGMPVDAERRLLPSTGAVSACSWGPDRLDVFTRAVDGRVYHCFWDGRWDHD